MIDFVEDKDILTEEEKYRISKDILDNNFFPWFWMPSSSSESYPFYGHILATRNDDDITLPTTDLYWRFYEIFNRMIEKHNIFPGGYSVMRAALNDSLSSKDINCDPHIDHNFPHMVFILYLNESSGKTLVYEEKYETGKETIYLNRLGIRNMNVKYESSPEPFKIIGFNGLHYHSMQFKKPDERRTICVFTIKNKED